MAPIQTAGDPPAARRTALQFYGGQTFKKTRPGGGNDFRQNLSSKQTKYSTLP
jgi:hypothetical protein